LIGNPIRLVFSKRSLEKGGIEIKYRNQESSEVISLDSLIDKIIAK
jgi:prolyl-tRNA synthetase